MSETLFDKGSIIGDIVSSNYKAASIFYKYGIDFCCGGSRTLHSACNSLGIPVESVIDELSQYLNDQDLKSTELLEMSVASLIQYILEKHHSYIRRIIPEITQYASKVSRAHGKNHPEMCVVQSKFEQLSTELDSHLKKEENSVFPALISYENSINEKQIPDKLLIEEISKFMNQLDTEHIIAGGLMKEIHDLSNNFVPPSDGCNTFRILLQNLDQFEKDLHTHVHLENNVLFKKMEKLMVK